MKSSKVFFSLVLAAALFIGAADSYAAEKKLTKKEMEMAEDNLLVALNSDNYELSCSSAYMLGELKVEKSVIPLLKVLKSDKDENMRILAALSLYKIGDERGFYAIKEASKFDPSARVKKHCRLFYLEHLSDDGKVNFK